MSCIAVLGGSFDPVHQGHVALARHFIELLQPDALRIVPAGNPWQKPPLRASGDDRIAMLELAFAYAGLPCAIDTQEITRQGPTYSIDTLRAIRQQIGADDSLVFLMGADQLRQLDTWRDWQQLFDYAHLCVAARPGYSMNAAHVPEAVQREFSERAATPVQIRSRPHGFTCLSHDLAVDVSSTAIRTALEQGNIPAAPLPRAVLDYIQDHHLYQR
jgi:nicotinate-nucleotide adenylyltransferase